MIRDWASNQLNVLIMTGKELRSGKILGASKDGSKQSKNIRNQKYHQIAGALVHPWPFHASVSILAY